MGQSSLISRRELIQRGMATGAVAALGVGAGGAIGQVVSDTPITRAIPSTGQAIPAIGIGTNRFGVANYNEVTSVLGRMHEMGGTVIDTAAVYGTSEEAIGRALTELDLHDEMFIATKFDAAGVSRAGADGLASFERSLKRLQREQIDLLFAHNINSVEPLMPTLMSLKEAGRVRYIGITTVNRAQHSRMMGYLREYPIDFIQIDYSLGNRAAATDVFPLALERGIAVMLAVPFAAGRGSLFSVVGDRELPEWADELGATSWSQIFLKYAVSHPAVTCAIPGTTDTEHLVENQLAGRGQLPDAAMRRRIEEFWDQIT